MLTVMCMHITVPIPAWAVFRKTFPSPRFPGHLMNTRPPGVFIPHWYPRPAFSLGRFEIGDRQ